MPDDDELDELEVDGVDGATVADMLAVEALMGWDGDRCGCPDCACERFVDRGDVALCAPCLAGDHFRADG